MTERDKQMDLSVLANGQGIVTIAALDHRDALKVELAKIDVDPPTTASGEAVRAFKRDMLTGLAALDPQPSAVMLEPEFSLPELAAAVPEGVGITCALEAQGYLSDPSAGNSLMPGWSPSRVTEVGAHASKLLVLYRHDRSDFTAAQEDLVTQVVEGSIEAGVPALIEPVPIDVQDDVDRRNVIVASAERFSKLGPMLLKLPYPGPGACAEVTEAAGDLPWILLSWGVPFDEFADQLAEACEHGCSGFAVGRALWREAVDPTVRARFNETILGERFAKLQGIAATGRPWFEAAANHPQLEKLDQQRS